jgi:hypothetical protein
MSADNWGKCPKCGREENLREDYGIGMWSGQFTIDYHAECGYGDHEGCGYRFQFKISLDPFAAANILPGRVTTPTFPAPPDLDKEHRELRESALARMTPEERAAFGAA